MKRCLLILIVAATAGCGRPDDSAETPDPYVVRLEQLEEKLADADRSTGAQLDQIQRQLGESSTRARHDVRDLEIRLTAALNKVQQLEATVRALEAATHAPGSPAPQPLAEPEQTQETGPAVTTAPTPPTPTESFPVSIRDLLGATVITGTHPSSREVETDEVYRDEFGQKVKRKKTETVVVNEYAYQARFTAENLTDQPVNFTASAGREALDFSLPPGEALEGISVDWTPGSPLTITANGQRKKHTIPWHQDQADRITPQ
ncbi:MAG: hypothetical protein BWY59_00415 [Verrucomicrobia bacterium ADurb.Bin345]|nr:MAG: hypothetical protein BWY59_00415 [Verrucomicrobia bacterium ADurb.Bin345]